MGRWLEEVNGPASTVAGGDHKPCIEFRGEPGLLVDCKGTPAALFRFGELGREG